MLQSPPIREPNREQRDWLSAQGADVMAQQIRLFWALYGYKVKTDIERVGDLFCVRSDLISGRPTGPRMTRG